MSTKRVLLIHYGIRIITSYYSISQAPNHFCSRKLHPSSSSLRMIDAVMESYRSNVVEASSSTSDVKMVAGSFYIPKDNEQNPRGEDAHFINSPAQTFGVADGVGGWASEGIDAGRYARELMDNSVISIVDNQHEAGIGIEPRKVLTDAFLNTKAEGSSTACIITVADDYLRAVNVGDSGFVHIRDGKVIYRSPVQQHFFNCPYQLGRVTNDLCFAMDIERFLEPRDIIVAGTDGLFDNVHEEEIEELVIQGLQDYSDMPELLAMKLAYFALDKSRDETAFTPFAVESQKAGMEHIGGKYDDITVVVAFILPSDQSVPADAGGNL